MRHCSWNNYRDVQSMELARHRHLQSINIFLFFPVWADRGVVGFLCEGSFLHSHLRQTVFILTKSPCLFSRLIFVFAKKRSTLKRKAKWNERGFDIKYCAARSKHDLLLKAQPDFADLKLEVLFWFFFFYFLHPSSCWGSSTSGNGSWPTKWKLSRTPLWIPQDWAGCK